ncbi:MAG: SUMF1/EgtB/PvdO family nonheme iron enzyme [Candidatus Nealsonbacteria bacterium]|nr:SUMF1/EgtB/PvdO family nonheme iron enzyme [Candidatus Nealsonbacteria bacterium]
MCSSLSIFPQRHILPRTVLAAATVLILFAGLIFPAVTTAEPAGSFEIPAWAFDRGNAKTFTSNWADAEPMVAFGGDSPTVVEYDIEFPVAATYTLSIRYAAATARPADLYLDKSKLGTVCREATGGWNTSGAKWESTKLPPLAAGKHTIKLQRGTAFPHVVALRLESDEPFPKDWKLHRPKARTLASPAPVAKSERYAPGYVDPATVRLAIVDLIETFGPKYSKGPQYLARLADLEKKQKDSTGATAEEVQQINDALVALRREALLANPLLDFDELLLVKRGVKSPKLGLPQNWQSNSCLPKTGFDDSIEVLSPIGPEGELATLYKPEGGKFVGDVDLDFDGEKMLFSMPGSNNHWQIFEIRTDGTALRELTGEQPDVDCYDACYLPNGRIMITSTACFIGVPCVYGGSHVSVLYVMDADGGNIRQLGFDQDHDWCPVVMNNGRVMYLRWEYTDTPHSNTRLLFHMNPDGTEQMEYYGSNSYWPNSTFYARPIPGHPTKIVGVVGGHHDNPRMGELIIFDPKQGRHEATGAVQRIPGHGEKVEAIISDGLTRNSWPKFLHPYPLSENHFLVSMKPTSRSLWGLYLVDVFDNMVLLKELPGYALMEPIPLRKTSRPPIIPDKVDLTRKDALVYISDIYAGGGLKGIPRGQVKSLRLFTYHFSYQGMGGLLGIIGMDGPWDIKRVMGTVPVADDGSVKFRVPANMPISIQPLDHEGKALQLMRSWMTAMPGETVSCSGCHERQNTAPIVRRTIAGNQPPSNIKPWHGPMRGFSYPREVQPVIDKYCVGCHDGKTRPDGSEIASLRGDVRITDWKQITPGTGGNRGGKFSVGYAELHRYVRRPGIESDYHMLEPMEYHADSTQLVQMLKKGHHNVKLDDEAWDRLVTWIDLNCPYHGTWGEELDDPGVQRQRRRELLKLYGGIDDDPEAVPVIERGPVVPVMPAPLAASHQPPLQCPNWPFDAAEAKRRQAAAGAVTRQTVELGEGLTLDLALIPAGQFVMGRADGQTDERPLARVKIDRPFWIGTCEVTNAQYALFDPQHDSRVESKNTYQFGIHGYPMNGPEQPVVRVPWQRAMEFCRWLSEQTGMQCTLPSEAQWEYACRAGTDAPFFYGDGDVDFSTFANLCDAKMTEFASNPYTVNQPLKNPPKYDDWIPKETRFNDGSLLSVAPGKYLPNPWGLFDMHGNVAEWTRTTYRAYPYNGDDEATPGRKVVRGGSWRDRPKRSTSSFRLSFQPYQKVYNVGFRVVCEAKADVVAVKEE